MDPLKLQSKIELPSAFSQSHVFLKRLKCSNADLLLHKSQAIKDLEAGTVVDFEKITPGLLQYNPVAHKLWKSDKHVHFPGSISEVKKSEFEHKYYPPNEYSAMRKKYGSLFVQEIQVWAKANCDEFDKQQVAYQSKSKQKNGGGNGCKQQCMNSMSKFQKSRVNKLLKIKKKYKELSPKEDEYSPEEQGQIYKVFTDVMGDPSSSVEEQKENLREAKKVVKKKD